MQCFYALVFLLEGILEQVRFSVPCNVVIDKVFIFTIEENISCAKFILPCNFVVGNIIVIVIVGKSSMC